MFIKDLFRISVQNRLLLERVLPVMPYIRNYLNKILLLILEVAS